MFLVVIGALLAAFCVKRLLLKKKFLNITDKAVLITGCDSGLGYQIAFHLHSLGFTVISGCLSKNSDGAVSLQKCSVSKRMLVIEMDVTDEASLIRAKNEVDSFLRTVNLPGIWALINNAGICIFGEFDWCSTKQCEKQIDINFTGTIRVTKYFLDSIIKCKGRVINIGSVNSLCAIPGCAVYSATKYAINGFSDALRYELRKLGVKVIVINPGDFSRITKIMDQQANHVDEMWNSMDSLKRNLYENYFKEYQNHVITKFGVTSAKRFDDTTLFEDIQEAVLREHPRFTITCAPFSSKFSFFILAKLPLTLRHTLFDLLLKYTFKLDVRNFFEIK